MKNRPALGSTRKVTRQNVKGYLLSRGIPPQQVNEILYVMTSDAIEEADSMIYDRIYSMIAIMLHDVYGFGPRRITRGLQYCSRKMNGVSAVKGDWATYAEELREKTGFVIHSDHDNRLLMEYQGRDWKNGKDVTNEEV